MWEEYSTNVKKDVPNPGNGNHRRKYWLGAARRLNALNLFPAVILFNGKLDHRNSLTRSSNQGKSSWMDTNELR